MSKILFDEQPIVVSRELAKLIGLNEAIVLQQVHYWLEINRKAEKNFHNGRYWTYNSIRAWHEENFDFWSYDTVKRTFAKLEKMNLLLSNNFNKESRDKTKWYSINEKALEVLQNTISAECTNEENSSEIAEIPIGAFCTNAKGQNAPMQKGKMHQPLPEISSEISSEISLNQSINQEKPKKIDMIDEYKNEKTPFPVSEEKASINNAYDYSNCKSIIAENINFDHLKRKYPYENMIDDILELMTEIMLSTKKTERINSEDKPMSVIKSKFKKINSAHIEYVILSLKNNTTKANNIRAYLLTTLYNSSQTMNSYYSNWVNHDMQYNWEEQK